MKKIIASIFCAIAGVLQASEPVSVYVKNAVSRYYLGSVGADFSDKELSFSNEVTVSKGNLYAGLWMATGPGPSKYKEDWDPYVGFVHTSGKLRYEISATYFVLSNIYESCDDLWMIDQKLSRRFAPTAKSLLQPYVKVRCFNKVGSRSFESGWFGWIGMEWSHTMRSSKFTADLSTAYSDGPFGKTPGLVYERLTASLAIPIWKKVTVTPSLIFQVPIGGHRHAQSPFVIKNELVWGIAVGYPLELGGANR